MAEDSGRPQEAVAKSILGYGGGAVLAVLVATSISQLGLVWGAVFQSWDAAKIAAAKGILDGVFGATLPLVGVWVGAVVSYYFGKDNFEQAAKAVHKAYAVASGDGMATLDSKLVKDVLAQYSGDLLLVSDELTLNETIAKVQAHNATHPMTHRLPVVSGKTKKPVGYVELDELVRDVPAWGDKSILSYLQDPATKQLSTARYSVVSVAGTMRQVASLLARPGICIVYATASGSKEEDILGVLTSKDVAKCLV